mgnify:CR=1 FL=1
MFKTILLTVDVNDLKGSERPAEVALQMTKAEGGVLHVMNVVPDYGMSSVGSFFGPEHSKKILAEARSALENWGRDHFSGVPDVRYIIEQGTIYDRILKKAEDIGADAIVVGAHKSQLQDYLIGPNAARITRHASQSVFVIR